MPRPYSDDLRWRVVYLREFMGFEYEDISLMLTISISSVKRYHTRFLVSAQVHGERMGRLLGCASMHPYEQLVLMEAVLEHPEKTLAEIVNTIYYETGSMRTMSAVFYYLKRNGLTRKKDKRISRSYGYSIRGTRAEFRRLRQNWGARITAIPVVCTDGMIDVGIYRGHMTGERFLEFVQEKLAPHLLPFNGFNPRSVVVMDNAAIHHTREVVNAINQTGALLVFLPPYSPDFMPCEGMFAQTKAWIRENDIAWHSYPQPEIMVHEAFLQIPDQEIRNYISHSDYV